MTTSETLYRAEELFQEKLKAKTNWGRNELIKEFQACIRQALGENLDAYEAKDANEGSIRPKGDGNVTLGSAQKHRTIDLGHSDPAKQDRYKNISVGDGDSGKIVYHDKGLHDEEKPDGITRIGFNDDDNPF